MDNKLYWVIVLIVFRRYNNACLVDLALKNFLFFSQFRPGRTIFL